MYYNHTVQHIIKSIFTVVLIVIAQVCTAQVAVEAKLNHHEIFLGQQTILTITVNNVSSNDNVTFPQYKSRDNIIDEIEIIETQEIEEERTGTNLKTVSKNYVLTSFEDSLYLIPAQIVKVNNKSYRSNPIPIKVLSINTDSLDLDKFYPPKDIQKNPFLLKEWLFVALLLLVAILLGCGTYTKFRKSRTLVENEQISKETKSEKSLYDIYLSEIVSLKQNLSANPKDYYIKATAVLRKFIHKRYGIDALEKTSGEIITALYEKNVKHLDELQSLFTTADLAKFARYMPSNDKKEADLLRVKDFIQQNNIDYSEMDETKQQYEKEQKPNMKSSYKLRDKVVLWLLCMITAALLVFIIWRIFMLIE